MGEVTRTNGVSSLTNASDNPNLNELEQLVLGALEEVKTSGGREIIDESAIFKPNITAARLSETSSGKCAHFDGKSPASSYLTAEKTQNQIQSDFHQDRSTSGRDFSRDERGANTATEEASLSAVVSVEIPLEEATFVVIEQEAVDQINQYLSQTNSQAPELNAKNSGPSENAACVNENQAVNADEHAGTEEISSIARSTSTGVDSLVRNGEEFEDELEEELDTQKLAQQLTDELKRYSIPQAVFARKVLNRSQGTLSDVLRKPKPWQELKGGKEVFKKMKEWLQLPEVKRIPQLRTEGEEPFHLFNPFTPKLIIQILPTIQEQMCE